MCAAHHVAAHHVGAFAAFAAPAAFTPCATFTLLAAHHVCSSPRLQLTVLERLQRLQHLQLTTRVAHAAVIVNACCSSASARDSPRVCAAHRECALLISEYARFTTNTCCCSRVRVARQRVHASHHECVLLIVSAHCSSASAHDSPRMRATHCECV